MSLRPMHRIGRLRLLATPGIEGEHWAPASTRGCASRAERRFTATAVNRALGRFPASCRFPYTVGMEICVYCDSPEIRDREISRDPFTRAFPTNIPITPGHTLVVPVRHVAHMSDLTPEEHTALFAMIERIESALRSAYKAEGFNVAWNEGVLAGQSVPHLHIHVVPRTEGDTGVLEYEPRKFLYRPGLRETTPEDELRDVASEIKKALP